MSSNILLFINDAILSALLNYIGPLKWVYLKDINIRYRISHYKNDNSDNNYENNEHKY